MRRGSRTLEAVGLLFGVEIGPSRIKEYQMFSSTTGVEPARRITSAQDETLGLDDELADS